MHCARAVALASFALSPEAMSYARGLVTTPVLQAFARPPAHCSSFVSARTLQQPATRRDRASGHRSAGRPRAGVRSLEATLPNDLKGKERLEKFLADCELLGPVRFVCMTDASILEAVGSFDNLRYSDLPKGRYATMSEGKGFECHLNTDKVKSIHMVTKRSPTGDYDLYITRFLDDNDETVLSAMLHAVEGSYEPGAADYWEKLRDTFGAKQTIE